MPDPIEMPPSSAGMSGKFPGRAGSAGTGARPSGGAGAFIGAGAHRVPGLAQHALEILGAAFRAAAVDLFILFEDQDLEAFVARQTPEFEYGHVDGLSLGFYR
jgi:hypothetical protein